MGSVKQRERAPHAKFATTWTFSGVAAGGVTFNVSVIGGAAPEEAEFAIEEAAAVHRRLADANPAAYLPNLATSLNNLSIRLDEPGRPDEAKTASSEAERIQSAI
jgi:hypothetical protein